MIRDAIVARNLAQRVGDNIQERAALLKEIASEIGLVEKEQDHARFKRQELGKLCLRLTETK